MPASFPLVLQIAAIGLGLVFGALVLFWGLMTLLVRLTAEPAPARDPDRDLRARAAALAVAAALAGAAAAASPDRTAPPVAAPPGIAPAPGAVSAWQSVMRAQQLSQRGRAR